MGIDKNTVCKWVRDYRRAHNFPTYAEENGMKIFLPREIKVDRARNKELEEKLQEKEKELKRLKKQLADEREIEKIFRRSNKTYGYRTGESGIRYWDI